MWYFAIGIVTGAACGFSAAIWLAAGQVAYFRKQARDALARLAAGDSPNLKLYEHTPTFRPDDRERATFVHSAVTARVWQRHHAETR